MIDRLDRFLQPQFVIAILLIAMFAWAFGENVSDDTMKGALIAAFAGAWGYFLGSSRNASAQTENVGKALDLANGAPSSPDIVLKPGETAQAERRP